MINWDGHQVQVAADGALRLQTADWALHWRLGGAAADLSCTRVDPDEVEASGLVGQLSITVRHSFDGAWHTRITLENTGSEETVLHALPMEWTVTGSASGWVWDAGAAGLHAVLPDDGSAALVQRVRSGDLREETGLAPVRLAPGVRQVIMLKGHWCPAEQLPAVLPAWLPTLDLAAGEPLRLVAPDLAVGEAGGLQESAVDGGREFLPDAGSGIHRLTLHGVDGVTRLDAAWSPAAEELIIERAHGLQGRPPVTALDALVLGRGGAGDPDDDHDAPGDLIDGWLARHDGADAWTVLVAAERALAGGDLSTAERALADVVRLAPEPGCGFAVLRALAAAVTLGLDPQPALAALGRLSTTDDPDVRLELAALVPDDPNRPRLAARLLARLGQGLPGDPVRPDGREAARIAVAQLVSEQGGAASLLGEVAQARTRRLLARGATDEELAWLTMG